MTAGVSAICGTQAGETKLPTSIEVSPARSGRSPTAAARW
jgi:hypothetical protein